MQHLVKRTVFSLVLACLCSGSLLADEVVSPSPALPADQVQIEAALRPLVKIASQGDKSAPEQIASQIKSLAGKTGNDPRLHYLHGLSLLKNFRHAEAMAAMKAGANHKIYYFPIHHFLIYEQVREKKYDAAIEGLVDLSARIGDPGQVWTSEVDRLDAARWLGRMVVFLSGPCGETDVSARMKAVELVIRTQLTPLYEGEMDTGVDELHAEHRELQVSLLSTEDQAAAKKREEARATAEAEQKVIEQRKDLSLSARQNEAVLQEQVREIDSQLAALEAQYTALETTQERLTSQIKSVRNEIIGLPFTFELARLAAPNRFAGPNRGAGGFRQAIALDEAIAIKELELQGYLVDFQANTERQRKILLAAEQAMAARRQAAALYQQSSSQELEKANGLARWDKRLKKSSKRSAATIDRKTDFVRTRISSLSSYESFNAANELADYADALGIGPQNP